MYLQVCIWTESNHDESNINLNGDNMHIFVLFSQLRPILKLDAQEQTPTAVIQPELIGAVHGWKFLTV